MDVVSLGTPRTLHTTATGCLPQPGQIFSRSPSDPHPAQPEPPDNETRDTATTRSSGRSPFAVTATTWRQLGGSCEDYTGYGCEVLSHDE